MLKEKHTPIENRTNQFRAFQSFGETMQKGDLSKSLIKNNDQNDQKTILTKIKEQTRKPAAAVR